VAPDELNIDAAASAAKIADLVKGWLKRREQVAELKRNERLKKEEEERARQEKIRIEEEEQQRQRDKKKAEEEVEKEKERVEAAKDDTLRVASDAKMGDLTITLKWSSGSSDLDLHCRSPGGHEIYYKSFKKPQFSPCGGQLDIDYTSIQPGGSIENIYWEKNAPRGKYTVWVNNYSGEHDTPFDLSVAGGGEDKFGRPLVKRFTNMTTPKSGGGDNGRKLRVCEFEYNSKIEKIIWHFARQ